MAFAHLALAVPDPEAAADFFERTMRWRRIPVPANAPVDVTWVQVAPGQALHLIAVPGAAPDTLGPFETEFGRHHAFLHPGADYDAVQDRLRDAGAELIAAQRPTPFRRFFFRDPVGYVFEIIHADEYAPES